MARSLPLLIALKEYYLKLVLADFVRKNSQSFSTRATQQRNNARHGIPGFLVRLVQNLPERYVWWRYACVPACINA